LICHCECSEAECGNPGYFIESGAGAGANEIASS